MEAERGRGYLLSCLFQQILLVCVIQFFSSSHRRTGPGEDCLSVCESSRYCLEFCSRAVKGVLARAALSDVGLHAVRAEN